MESTMNPTERLRGPGYDASLRVDFFPELIERLGYLSAHTHAVLWGGYQQCVDAQDAATGAVKITCRSLRTS